MKYQIKEKDNIKHIKNYFISNKDEVRGINLGSYKITGVGNQSLMLKHSNGDSEWVNYIDLIKSIKNPNEASRPIALIIKKFIAGVSVDIKHETESEEIFRKIIDKTERYTDLLEIQLLLQDKIEKLQEEGKYRERLDLNKLFDKITITPTMLKSSNLLKFDEEELDVDDETKDTKINLKLTLNLLEDILKKDYNVSTFKYRGITNLNLLKELIKWQIEEITGIFNAEHTDGFFKIHNETKTAEIYFIK
jgi:hypothetical protein